MPFITSYIDAFHTAYPQKKVDVIHARQGYRVGINGDFGDRIYSELELRIATRAFQRGAAVAGERVYNDIAVPLLGRFGHAVINTGMAMALNAVSGRGGLLGVNSNPSRLAIG